MANRRNGEATKRRSASCRRIFRLEPPCTRPHSAGWIPHASVATPRSAHADQDDSAGLLRFAMTKFAGRFGPRNASPELRSNRRSVSPAAGGAASGAIGTPATRTSAPGALATTKSTRSPRGSTRTSSPHVSNGASSTRPRHAHSAQAGYAGHDGRYRQPRQASPGDASSSGGAAMPRGKTALAAVSTFPISARAAASNVISHRSVRATVRRVIGRRSRSATKRPYAKSWTR